MPVSLDYLVIGHITKDLYDQGYKLGGTATYSALTAHHLGCRVGVVTSTGPDVDLSQLPAEIRIASRPCTVTTTFQNVYHEGHRKQHISAQATVLGIADVPTEWRDSAIVHLGPIAQEIEGTVVGAFPKAVLGLTPQGWMRAWDEEGFVHAMDWHPAPGLAERADAVILSREDIDEDAERIERYAASTCTLVLTAGWKGSTVYHKGQVRSFPAPAVNEVDPTGAGDIFATAYLVALWRTEDPFLAAQFANCIAAHSVERSGLASIPTRDEIARCRARFGDKI